MQGDFSRFSFDPLKNFSRVLMQQGRVQLDADWNEQGAILTHQIRALARTLIGPHGGSDAGFQIVAANEKNDFGIAYGSYYVDGILCENLQAPVCGAKPAAAPPPPPPAPDPAGVPVLAGGVAGPPAAVGGAPPVPTPVPVEFLRYTLQPNFLGPDALLKSSFYLVYLLVWERLITFVQDDSIREKALGGPDTAARAKIVWQVRTLVVDRGLIDSDRRLDAVTDLLAAAVPKSTACLKMRLKPPSGEKEPCVISPESGFRGLENQLYRVEIHKGGKISGEASFKWSRENASVIFPVSKVEDKNVFLTSLGRDARYSLQKGSWVEFENDESVLSNHRFSLAKVDKVFPDTVSVSLDKAFAPIPDPAHSTHSILRRWEGPERPARPNAGTGKAADEANWIDLENGIQVLFQAGGNALPGDYWLIPARIGQGTNDLNSDFRPALGIHYHQAPLAVIGFDEESVLNTDIKSLRRTIKTLTE